MPATLKPVTPDHIPSLLALMRLLQDDDPWSVPFDEDVLHANLHELLADAVYGSAYFIVDGEATLGYIVLCFDYSLEYRGKGAWVDEFFVLKDLRGRGIGAEVLVLAEREARRLGAKVLHLEVNHGNPALDLYRRHGFEDHQRYLMTKWL